MKNLFKINKLSSKDIGTKKSKKIYNFLVKNIKNTTFQAFGYNFFLSSLRINFKNTFYIEHNKKIVSYISYINQKNEKKIKKMLIKQIMENPLKNFLVILLNFKFFFKLHDQPKKFIQLMHLIIKLNINYNQNNKRKLNKIIENLHKQIIKSKYIGVYALYENVNLVAAKYYDKNNFKIFDKNFFYTFVKKKIKNT